MRASHKTLQAIAQTLRKMIMKKARRFSAIRWSWLASF